MPTPADITRFALGVVYLWFGALKLFPDLSTAELLAEQTILRLRLGLGAHEGLIVLAVFECALGLLFLFRIAPRLTLLLFALHMAGTLAPLVLLPELTFRVAPFAPTFEGQYILKNLVFLAAGYTLYCDARAPVEAP